MMISPLFFQTKFKMQLKHRQFKKSGGSRVAFDGLEEIMLPLLVDSVLVCYFKMLLDYMVSP
jgi:hypothetical protein